jgi:quercetin dioxygenase-like cupin family protein
MISRAVRAACLLLPLAATPAAAADGTVVPLLAKDLPGLASGAKEGVLLTVEYPPGGATPAHLHRAHVFVYVLEGAVVMQVAGGPEVTLTAGQTFYESPDDVHTVSRNASATQPAKMLVLTIKDKGAPVLVPAH